MSLLYVKRGVYSNLEGIRQYFRASVDELPTLYIAVTLLRYLLQTTNVQSLSFSNYILKVCNRHVISFSIMFIN